MLASVGIELWNDYNRPLVLDMRRYSTRHSVRVGIRTQAQAFGTNVSDVFTTPNGHWESDIGTVF